jgi:hypothetical protein
MNTYYKTSADYHDDLDRFEAQARAEREEIDLVKIYNDIVAINKDQPDANRQAAEAIESIIEIQDGGVFSFADYKADYQERNDLYIMGNGG